VRNQIKEVKKDFSSQIENGKEEIDQIYENITEIDDVKKALSVLEENYEKQNEKNKIQMKIFEKKHQQEFEEKLKNLELKFQQKSKEEKTSFKKVRNFNYNMNR